MSTPVIKAENLSKLYRLGEVGTGSLAHDINRWWHTVRGKEDPYALVGQVNDRTRKSSVGSRQSAGKKSAVVRSQSSATELPTDSCQLPTANSEPTSTSTPNLNSELRSDYVWALKDINFEVHQGEVLGIIGRNGAGKSTLLKILSRVTGPTTGSVKVKGRIASLLEVGTGFHHELTGRENIYLNGAILGMRNRDIDARLEEIVDFSGCAAYLDTPVKRYSSGMQVRLAFAVAAHLDPEILIIDEVLAVGDAEFQNRCVARMNAVANSGRTVLFVSHSLNVVRRLTHRSIVLEQGRIAFEGDTNSAIGFYTRDGSARTITYSARPISDDARITAVHVKTSQTGGINLFGEPLEVLIEVTAPKPLRRAALSFQVLDCNQQPIIYQLILDSETPFLREPSVRRFRCVMPHLRLYPGNYTLNVHLAEAPHVRYIESLPGVCAFSIAYAGPARDHDWQPGLACYLETAEWSIQ